MPLLPSATRLISLMEDDDTLSIVVFLLTGFCFLISDCWWARTRPRLFMPRLVSLHRQKERLEATLTKARDAAANASSVHHGSNSGGHPHSHSHLGAHHHTFSSSSLTVIQERVSSEITHVSSLIATEHVRRDHERSPWARYGEQLATYVLYYLTRYGFVLFLYRQYGWVTNSTPPSSSPSAATPYSFSPPMLSSSSSSSPATATSPTRAVPPSSSYYYDDNYYYYYYYSQRELVMIPEYFWQGFHRRLLVGTDASELAANLARLCSSVLFLSSSDSPFSVSSSSSSSSSSYHNHQGLSPSTPDEEDPIFGYRKEWLRSVGIVGWFLACAVVWSLLLPSRQKSLV